MTWWTKLETAQKALAAIAAIACALILTGAMLGDLLALPDRVASLEDDVRGIHEQQRELIDTARRTNCYLDNLIENTNKRCP